MDFLSLLASAPSLFVAVCAALGLLVGSFLNVVIHRLPKMMEREWRAHCAELSGEPSSEEREPYSLVTPRSHCPHCGHTIGALENIPLLSYLLQGGRCRHCGMRIALRYPLIEVLSGLLCGFAAWHFGWGYETLAAMLFTWALLALTVIDLDHQLLPDAITLPLIWLGLLFNLFGIYTDLQSAVIGAMAGYLALWSVYHLFRLLTGKEGMGYGDFKLLAACGAWLGWQLLPVIIILSSLVGALVGIGLILFRGHGRSIPIPFGPYLAAAGWLALYWGEHVTQAYLNWIAPGSAL